MEDKTVVAKDSEEVINDHDTAPPKLWRLYSIRLVHGKSIRHINWFTTQEAAEKHSQWVTENNRGKVISVNEYTLTDSVIPHQTPGYMLVTLPAYKNYVGKAEYDQEEKRFYGEVLDILPDVATFSATNIDDLEKEFQITVDDYLEHAGR